MKERMKGAECMDLERKKKELMKERSKERKYLEIEKIEVVDEKRKKKN